MSAKRFLKRSLFFLGLTFILCGVSGAALLYTYQDQLVSRFIKEANEKIDTPIQAGKITASWWEKFPHVSIILSEVMVDGSLPGATDTLAVAENIYCAFNAWDIIRGEWTVEQIHLKNGRLFLVQTELGDNNFTIVKKDTTRKQHEAGFILDQVRLQDMAIAYLDLNRNHRIDLGAQEVTASVVSTTDTFDIELDGSITSEAVSVNNMNYLAGKPLIINGNIQYTASDKMWDLKDIEVTVNESGFLVNGFYRGNDSNLDMTVKSHNTDIQTVLSLLPEETRQKFEKYRSRGELYFNGHLQGSSSENESLGILVEFGSKGAAFYHPEYRSGIKMYTSPEATAAMKLVIFPRVSCPSGMFGGPWKMSNSRETWRSEILRIIASKATLRDL